ncbi:hypothetical protein M409DRAFT_16452 [Zasmidium cellare ATCC 36951]|uniref:Heterokaryon incompatibility domain-containing protein n=1 Tax=Zasmidium cellare ATCC 36951 TaxID=1080233 RepID=A0A6A6D7G7_ZASCE|nr:uncharacterized protein M409DRAFT_16452 [Zasmidium cellare ATCC 36951]KAF2174182.1 hypothetical protein M409DRAFT_16452 [Zasmidium cellare ATCC 36951]
MDTDSNKRRPSTKQDAQDHVVLDTKQRPTYAYDGLPTHTSIRLISGLRKELVDGIPLVDTTNGSNFPVVGFSLRTVDLVDSLSYDCLSYTWGRPTRVSESKAIHDSSEELLERDNAPQGFKDEHPFSRLCGRNRSESLWIDSICINQEDVVERSQQVQIMDRIYRNANIVHAWLGEADLFSKVAIYSLSALSKLGEDAADRVRGLHPLHDNSAELGLEQRISTSAIYAFLKRSWFRRAWIVQEAVLAAELVIWCGPIQVSLDVLGLSALFLLRSMWWGFITPEVHSRRETGGFGEGISRILPPSALAKAAASLAVTDGRADLYETDADINSVFDPVYAILQIYDKRITFSKENQGSSKSVAGAYDHPVTSYERIFSSFRLLEATEPKDKVYAFLGLRPAGVSAGPLVPDYRNEKSYQAVYTEAMVYGLQTAGTLDLLAYKEDETRGRDSSLPSWVPDLRNPTLNLIQGASITPWSAAGNVPIHLAFREAHGTFKLLSLRGLLVDEVRNTATWERDDLSCVQELLAEIPRLYPVAKANEIPASTSSHQAASPSLDRDQHSPSNQDPTTQSRVEVLWRTLIADCCQHQHPAPRRYGLAFAKSLRRKMKMLETAVLCGNQREPSGPYKLQLLENAVSSYNHFAQAEMADFAFQVAEVPSAVAEGGSPAEPSRETQSQEPSPQEHLLRPFKSLFPNTLVPAGHISDSTTTHPADLREKESRTRALHEFEVRKSQMLDHRILFTTSTHGYLGLGPRSLRPGDQVWLLAGAKVPHVLRLKGNGRFELVGECYVHGIMHGEAVRGKEKEFVGVELE